MTILFFLYLRDEFSSKTLIIAVEMEKNVDTLAGTW